MLGGKTVDTNSAYFAKFCFQLGIALKRVEVIADDDSEIVEAVQRMSKNYDFVVTSGGIGPTHDDITYESIAKAFNLPLKLHDRAFAKMKKLSKPRANQPNFTWDEPSPALTAKLRMVQLPYDENRPDEEQVLFANEELWVPISVVNGNIHILPGVPRLFEALLEGIRPSLIPRLADPEGKGNYRILISTPMPESEAATYLTELSKKVGPKGIKVSFPLRNIFVTPVPRSLDFQVNTLIAAALLVNLLASPCLLKFPQVGSYPRWGKKRNIATLVGTDREYMDSLVPEVEKGVQGKRVTTEGEDDTDDEVDVKKDKDS